MGTVKELCKLRDSVFSDSTGDSDLSAIILTAQMAQHQYVQVDNDHA